MAHSKFLNNTADHHAVLGKETARVIKFLVFSGRALLAPPGLPLQAEELCSGGWSVPYLLSPAHLFSRSSMGDVLITVLGIDRSVGDTNDALACIALRARS